MSTLEAILLGAVQGATEFLPVSSSGHLVLGGYLLGLEETSLLFDIVLHVGTLLAIVWYYRADIRRYTGEVVGSIAESIRQRRAAALWESDGGRLAILIVLGSLPTALLGAGLDSWFDMGAGDRAAAIAVSVVLLVNGCILFSGRFLPEETGTGPDPGWHLWNITPMIALMIGTAQGLAVIPGLSRSGTTVITALALGVWRSRAAKFSFLLSIPAILGALALKFDPGVFAETTAAPLETYGLGAVVATITGYFCLVLLVRLIENASFHKFSWYCWGLGSAGLVFILGVQ